MQPGRSGAVARKPPPSSYDKGSMRMGYRKLPISGLLNKPNVDRLHRASAWNGDNIPLRRMRYLVMRSAAAWRRTAQTVLAADRLHVRSPPVRLRVAAHPLQARGAHSA